MRTKNVTSALAVLILFMLMSSTGGVLAYKASHNSQSTTSKSDDDHNTTSEDDDGPTTETETEYEHEPEYERDENGTTWIQTDIISVRLDDHFPSYQFWYTSDVNGSLAKFAVSYRTVVEFEDLNADGVYQMNETIASVPLSAFDWNLQTGSVTNENGHNEEVYATYIKGGLKSEEIDDDWTSENGDGNSVFSISDDDPGELDLSMYKDMTLQFYGHLYMDDYVGSITNDEGVQANYTISGGVEFKIDIEIGNFPFQSNTSKIAILNYLQEDLASGDNTNYEFVTHEEDGDHILESENISHDQGVKFENKDEESNNVTQGLSLIEGSTNITRGLYRWIDRALMTLPNSATQSVDVGASYWTDGNAMLLFLAYPNFDGGTLMHDPSLKLEEQSNPVTQTPTTAQTFPLELGIVAIGVVVIIGIAAISWKKR